MTDTPHPTCRTCPSVRMIPADPKYGACARKPPELIKDGQGSAQPPVTLDETWCDEHPEAPRRKP